MVFNERCGGGVEGLIVEVMSCALDDGHDAWI